MSRKPIYWVLLIVLSLSGTFFAYHYFPAAFPLVNLDLKMNREQAIETAEKLAQTHAWGPEEYREAASFDLDDTVQNFVELEAGGREAFKTMLTGDRYSPYRWVVRHFKEGEKNETIIRFTPAGDAYGFREKLAESTPGASLAVDSALIIAQTAAAQWPVDLSAYELVEKSQKVQIGGRTDHTFVYERPDEKLGEGSYRLRLVVGGDRLTELTHFVKIPEAFSRRYEEMRSANETIATGGLIVMGLLYGILGIGFGLFYLMRERWIIWKKPLYWGMFVAALQVLAMINRWPLTWMVYDTALSTHTFFLQQITMLILVFISETLLLTLSFMAAETLTRKAFPSQVQLWKIWEPKIASSKTVLGQTVGGYLAIGIFFAFDVALYFIATRILGWWSPSSALFEPDVLATYQPWFSSIAISLHAGFWEECLFRAIPIAGAVLIGRRYGKEKLALIIGFIIQILIFGAGHANYPNQPSYARMVELIVPSIGFGLIYLYYGLLPGIIFHFAYDVIWFALPLFVSTAPGIWT
ncbi:CPBP family intramembrane metalloprotease, partial [bacterium]|nr:CPBP family intramembrane metalloprotease [bacterium]